VEFHISDEVAKLGLVGHYFVIRGLSMQTDRNALDEWLDDYTRALPEPVESVLQGFRDLHTKVGRSNRKYVASPENLWKLVERRGSLPRINPLVDIYNAISLRSCLALGAHDLERVTGNIVLRLTTGSEGFHPLGAQPKPVAPGEYCYVDDANDVICRMEVRQVEKTKVSPETTDCFYIVQGNSNTPGPVVEEVADELAEVTTGFFGGTVEHLWP